MDLPTRAFLVLLLNWCLWLQSWGLINVWDYRICYSEDCNTTATRILESLDSKVNPCHDFYRFACGGYEQKTVIPQDKEVVHLFTEAQDILREKMKSIVFKSIDSNDPEPYKMLKTFMHTCMDEDRMDAEGVAHALRRLQAAGGWPVLGGWDERRWDLVTALATLYRVSFDGSDCLFGVGIGADMKQSTRWAMQIGEPKLLLKREILIKGLDDNRVKAYYDFMVAVAVIFGAREHEAKTQLMESLLFEIELAKLIRPKEANRNYEDSYNPYTLGKLMYNEGWIDWWRFFSLVLPWNVLPLKEYDEIIVADPKFLKGVGRLVAKHSPRVVANYVMWHGVRGYPRYLTRELKNKRLQFDKVVFGVTTRKPRWVECIDEADRSMEHITGSMYVKNFFDSKSRDVARKMMNLIHKEMEKVLKDNDWMDETTRKSALKKLSKMYNHIGYPDELLDMAKLGQAYSKVKIKRTDDFLSDVVQLNVLEKDTARSRLRSPINRTDWWEHSFVNQINAFYHPNENSVIILAGILQSLFFSKHLPMYVNLGKIGLVMGHEITHGFDDQGSQMDGDGNLSNWWGKQSLERFKIKSQCMVDLFNGFKDIVTDMKINGVIIQGETIADQGGLKLVSRVWNRLGRPGQELPGLQKFSREQVMLLSMANTWCEKKRPQSRKFQILTDPHPPSDIRINGMIVNYPRFQEVFHCKSSDPMVSKNKCVVW